jgi:hypothetical protein
LIPDWLYPAIAVACIALIAWRDERKAARRIANFRAIEAERADRIYSAIVRYGEPLTVEQIRAALALHDLRADVRRWER